MSNTADSEDPEDAGQKAVNYRTEPLWVRMDFTPDASLEFTRAMNFTNALSNTQVGGDPETPVFTAQSGESVRFRVLHPGGVQRNHVFSLHGHIWQEQPYTAGSTVIGDNPLSEWQGSRTGVGPGSHFDMVLENGAGGLGGITGDYLFRDMASFLFDGGLWGLLRVGSGAALAPAVVGDLDGDGDVDIDDLNLWNASPTDVNGDGLINSTDRSFLISQCTLPRCARP